MTRFKQKFLTVGLAVSVCVPLTSCTVNPITNEKFASFGSCVATNILMSTLGGVAGRKILVETGVKTATANTIAVAGTVLVAYSAWQKCAQSFQEVKYSDEVARAAMPRVGPNAPESLPGIRIDELSVVATKWGEPLVTTARYTLLSADPNKVDIPVVEKRTFASLTQPDIPPADFQNKIIANQGSRTANGKLDTPPDLAADSPNGPYKFTFEVQADGMTASKDVQYFFDGKKYSAIISAPVTAGSHTAKKDTSKDKPALGTASSLQKKKPVTVTKKPVSNGN